jgi:hypothetical protein
LGDECGVGFHSWRGLSLTNRRARLTRAREATGRCGEVAEAGEDEVRVLSLWRSVVLSRSRSNIPFVPDRVAVLSAVAVLVRSRFAVLVRSRFAMLSAVAVLVRSRFAVLSLSSSSLSTVLSRSRLLSQSLSHEVPI